MLNLHRIALIALLVFPAVSSAKTWYVEKDGSGDFVDLQSAADAAASGDTIRVGAGRFDERAGSACLGNAVYTIMALSEVRTVIVGMGDRQTVIGPADPWNGDDETRVGIAAVGFCGVASLVVRGVHFENLTSAVHCEFALTPNPGVPTRLVVEDCTFADNYDCISTDSRVAQVAGCQNSTALDGARFISSFLGAPVDSVVVRDCRSAFGGRGATHIGVPGSYLEVVGCILSGDGTGGASSGVSSSAMVFDLRESQFIGFRWGIVRYAGDVNVSDCVFENSRKGIWLADGDAMLNMDRCEFRNISVSSISYNARTPGGRITDCNLAKGTEFTVSHTPYGKSELATLEDLVRIDMTNNWWGTTDQDSIQAWIEDRYDDPDWPIVIDWEPFRTENVAAQESTLDGFKALFR